SDLSPRGRGCCLLSGPDTFVVTACAATLAKGCWQTPRCPPGLLSGPNPFVVTACAATLAKGCWQTPRCLPCPWGTQQKSVASEKSQPCLTDSTVTLWERG